MKRLLIALLLLIPGLAFGQALSTLANIGGVPASGDKIPIVDISDTTQSVNGTTKHVTFTQLISAIPLANITGMGTNCSAWLATPSSANLAACLTDESGASGGFLRQGGNAATATALAADGSNCSAGLAALGVDAAGAAQSCTDFMEEPGSNGLVAKTAANTAAARTITGTANEIEISNGDGVSGNPTIGLVDNPTITGKHLAAGAVNDDDCTGEQGKMWYDTTDSQWEVCNANTGVPIAIAAGGGSGDVVMGTETVGKACIAAGSNTIDCDSDFADMPASTAQGDLLYLSAADTLARLAKSASATRYLSNTGTNNDPAWAQVNLSNGVTNTLPAANGGLGMTTVTDDTIAIANGSAWESKSIPNCTDTGGNHLNYTAATNTISCGTSSSGGGGGNVSNTGTPTNTQLARWTNATTIEGFSTGTGVQTAMGNAVGTAGGLANVVAVGTASLGTSAISSGACATVVTVTATGMDSGDIIIWTPNASLNAVTGYAPTTNGSLIVRSYPTTNNVNFDVCNNTTGSITPGAVTLNWIGIARN